MADGTRLNPGLSGDLIQTEDLGASGKIPRSKIVIGALDADAGDVSAANPLPATISGTTAISGSVSISGITGALPSGTNMLGALRGVNGILSSDGGSSLTVATFFSTFNTSGNHSLVSGVAAKKVTVLAYRIQATNAAAAVNTVKFVDTAGSPADLSMAWDFNAREGVSVSAPFGSFEFQSGTALGVQINLSAAQPIQVMIQYYQA